MPALQAGLTSGLQGFSPQKPGNLPQKSVHPPQKTLSFPRNFEKTPQKTQFFPWKTGKIPQKIDSFPQKTGYFPAFYALFLLLPYKPTPAIERNLYNRA